MSHCGHNSFHYKCLHDWVRTGIVKNKYTPSRCPLCRTRGSHHPCTPGARAGVHVLLAIQRLVPWWVVVGALFAFVAPT